MPLSSVTHTLKENNCAEDQARVQLIFGAEGLNRPAQGAVMTELCTDNSAVRMSPVMARGLEQRLLNIGNIVKLIDGWEAA